MNQKGFTNIVILIVLVIAGIGAYFVLKKNVDSCKLINNSSFKSTELSPASRGQMGYSTVDFQGNAISWSHGDIIENGTYTCKDSVLKIKFSDRFLTAYYNSSIDALVLEGMGYKKINQELTTQAGVKYKTVEPNKIYYTGYTSEDYAEKSKAYENDCKTRGGEINFCGSITSSNGATTGTCYIMCTIPLETKITEKPKIVDYFACGDNCPGPREKYMVKVYEGIKDPEECKKIGGEPSSYVGWGTVNFCIAK
jgi:hypothetical protein